MNRHEGQPIHTRGRRLTEARAAMIMLHGRGATTESILSLVPELEHPEIAYLAPQAAGYTWYPFSFLEPLERNEPYLSSALGVIKQLVGRINGAGVPTSRIMLLGFSQGACLALEFAARNAARYGGVIGLSGGVIGPPGTPRDYSGSMGGSPVFLGCSDVDFHIPKTSVDESADVFSQLGGAVTKRLYPNMGHTVNDDEIAFVKTMLEAVSST
ncbi:MAG: dienelactone hydrolase family protein [Anaerolineae bacterium]|nr:dienelactone hydrolase family protein [Anaerolineae bacterium]